MISLDLEQFIERCSAKPYAFVHAIRNDDAGYSLWYAEQPALRTPKDEPYPLGREICLGSRRERVRRFKTLDAAVNAMHSNGYRGDICISSPRE